MKITEHFAILPFVSLYYKIFFTNFAFVSICINGLCLCISHLGRVPFSVDRLFEQGEYFIFFLTEH